MKDLPPVYLDYNATTPCDPLVLESMLPVFNVNFGNAASRQHQFGWKAAELVDQAREQVAKLIGSIPEEICFTSGATESVNLALKGVFEKYQTKGKHIITCATEHKAVLDSCRHLEKQGAEITILPVDQYGAISLEDLRDAIRPDTILLALMYANNETGVLHPVREIANIAREHKVIFFSDGTQALGKVPVNVMADGIDLMAFSAHKMYGPKGVGGLYVRRKGPRVQLTAQMDGGGHERGWRSGTLNVPGIVGLGMACEIALERMAKETYRLEHLRDELEEKLLKLGDVVVNGNLEARLPHTSNLSFLGVKAQELMTACQRELAVSAGSACTAANPEPSYVLKAMGLKGERLDGALRFSLGRFSSEEEVARAVALLGKQVKKLRKKVAPVAAGS